MSQMFPKSPGYDFIELKLEVKVKVSDPVTVYDTVAPRCIHIQTSLGFLLQIVYEICSEHDFSWSRSHCDPETVCNTPWPPRCISKPNLRGSYLILYRRYFSRTEARGQGHSELETVCDPQDVCTHQIWDSYVK